MHRREWDPISFVHKFSDPADQEVVAFLAALLAYGNVKSILSSVRKVLERLGESPARAIREEKLDGRFDGFYHRFTRGEDIEILCFWLRGYLRSHGTLFSGFMVPLNEGCEEGLRPRLSRFVRGLKTVPLPKRLQKVAGERQRNLKYLLSDPMEGSACKRLNMYLRWMVRPADGIDTGLWAAYPARHLVLPLDTHLLKTVQQFGWTKSKSANWRVAEEATARLREVSPEDPLRYDFSLCHLSMAGNKVNEYLKKHLTVTK